MPVSAVDRFRIAPDCDQRCRSMLPAVAPPKVRMGWPPKRTPTPTSTAYAFQAKSSANVTGDAVVVAPVPNSSQVRQAPSSTFGSDGN